MKVYLNNGVRFSALYDHESPIVFCLLKRNLMSSDNIFFVFAFICLLHNQERVGLIYVRSYVIVDNNFFFIFSSESPNESVSFKMFIRLVLSVVLVLTVAAKRKVVDAVPNLNGYYRMSVPGNGNQFVFNIDWSDTFNQYLVVVTGQPLAWATARLQIVNDTAVNLVCDNGVTLSGVISYPTDLPSICWPTFKDFTCWNRLLSNVSRIHVINM